TAARRPYLEHEPVFEKLTPRIAIMRPIGMNASARATEGWPSSRRAEDAEPPHFVQQRCASHSQPPCRSVWAGNDPVGLLHSSANGLTFAGRQRGGLCRSTFLSPCQLGNRSKL